MTIALSLIAVVLVCRSMGARRPRGGGVRRMSAAPELYGRRLRIGPRT